MCRLLEHGLSVTPFLRYDLQGKLVGKTEDRIAELESLYKKFGKKVCLLGWHEIRQLLFEYLPSDMVEFDKQVRRCLTSILNSVFAATTGCLPQCPSAPLAANFSQEAVQVVHSTVLSLQNALLLCSRHSKHTQLLTAVAATGSAAVVSILVCWGTDGTSAGINASAGNIRAASQ